MNIPNLTLLQYQKVKLPENSVRGGLMTQASLLKLTTNGTYTSPITRGVWLLDNLLGMPIPPPPVNVEALVPDEEDGLTIKEALAKHTEDPKCAQCHRLIDPVGFALENFDVIGNWRENYRITDKEKINIKDKDIKKYKSGSPVFSQGEFKGQKFSDIQGFKKIILNDLRPVTIAFVEKLLVYATGNHLNFTDHDEINQILQKSAKSKHGIRSIIHNIVQSRLFRFK